MKLRTAIAVTLIVAQAVALLGTTGTVSAVLSRAARVELTEALMRDRSAFLSLLSYRRALQHAESRIIADEPRLKAIAATDDVSRETVVGVIADLRRALRCDLLLVTDQSGRLLADSLHPEDRGDALGRDAVVATALERGESEGFWIDGTQALQVHGRRLTFGTMSVGAVVVGYRIDDALAAGAAADLGAGIVLLHGDVIVAASRLPAGGDLPRAALLAAIGGHAPASTAALLELQLAGRRYVATQAALPSSAGGATLKVVLLRSLDQALAPAQRLVRILYAFAALLFILSLWAARYLARRLAMPIDDLVAFTRRIAADQLEPTAAHGMDEVRALGTAMNRMVDEIRASRAELAEKVRLAKEIEIAQRVQVSMLPRDLRVAGLQIAAQMVPASEVGGDYYDVIPQSDGCWIAIGDVAGHGLPAGLVMLMLQSAFSALVRALPEATPRQITRRLNQVIYDCVRCRLNSDEHATFTALRYTRDGRLTFAGAHETLLVLRGDSVRCEPIETPGTWLGIIPNIDHALSDSCLQLRPGDIVALYTDGLTESVSATGEQFGLDRLSRALVACAAEPIDVMQARIMDVVRDFSPRQDDDRTLLLLRYEGHDAKG